MDWTALLMWVAGFLLTTLTGAAGWQLKAILRNTSRITKLEAAHEALDVKTELSDMHKRVDEVHGRITDLNTTVAENSGQLKALNNQLGVVLQHLLNQGKGADK